MSTLCVEWLCIQERWNPEVVIILGTAACYRRATVGSSHDDVHPDNPTLHTGAVRPHPGFVESLLFISSRNGLARKCSKCCQLFHAFRGRAFLRGIVQPYFSVGSLSSRRGINKGLTQWVSSFGISWCILSLVKKTLH